MRQFPHQFCRFNVTEADLRATILDAWARGDWVELGERKWSPHQAKLTVLQGPQLPVEQLSMGRGWRSAMRRSDDVTERMIALARKTTEGTQSSASTSSNATAFAIEGESLARELLKLLGENPVLLMRAWQLALDRHPDRTPSECLALAEGFCAAD